MLLAVRGGFEPPVRVITYASLANWWFQPLTHLTVYAIKTLPFNRGYCMRFKRWQK